MAQSLPMRQLQKRLYNYAKKNHLAARIQPFDSRGQSRNQRRRRRRRRSPLEEKFVKQVEADFEVVEAFAAEVSRMPMENVERW